MAMSACVRCACVSARVVVCAVYSTSARVVCVYPPYSCVIFYGGGTLNKVGKKDAVMGAGKLAGRSPLQKNRGRISGFRSPPKKPLSRREKTSQRQPLQPKGRCSDRKRIHDDYINSLNND